jgi:predicted dehydrogenase
LSAFDEKLSRSRSSAAGASRKPCRAIKLIDGLELCAAADCMKQRAQGCAEPLGIPCVHVVREDARGSASKSSRSRRRRDCIPRRVFSRSEGGKHVVTEKPMAISLKGADELVQACDAESVSLRREAEPAECSVQLLKRRWIAGDFGRLYMANCTFAGRGRRITTIRRHGGERGSSTGRIHESGVALRRSHSVDRRPG